MKQSHCTTASDNSLPHVIYFPVNKLNFPYFALLPLFTLEEWGNALLSPRAASQLSKATKPNEDGIPYAPAKTEAVSKLRCCYITTTNLISSFTLLPECPSHHCKNETHDGRKVVCRDIHTVPTAQET